MTTAHIGKPASRVDGRAKVSGQAKYAAEHLTSGLTYGWVISSAIASGRIVRIDASAALALPGVLQVFTHENRPRLAWLDRNYQDEVAPPGSPFRPLYDDKILFSAQPIALVVAESYELARYAATLVQIEYDSNLHSTSLESAASHAYTPKDRQDVPLVAPSRGDAERAFASSAVQIDVEYQVPVEHHNPMEMFGATVIYEEDGRLTVYDKTQGSQNVQNYLCSAFGYSKGDLRVLCPYVGGAFGSGLRPQYHVLLAVMAAQELKRSVRLTLTRQQMFSFGHRPAALQRVRLGASRDGKLEAVMHDVVSETSLFEDYSETIAPWSGLAYQCENYRGDHQIAKLNVYTPIDMRAPGAVWGFYALESAMDELAARLRIDPLELRLRNYAETDQNEGKPFSSKQLRACYEQGAADFGWSGRNPEPRSMRDGSDLVGWGMATACWEAKQQKASAKAVLTADGRLVVSSATADIGTGTYTIMTQIAAEHLGLPLDKVTFKLGDSSLPTSPVEGGSWTAATIGSAVKAACHKVRQTLLRLAQAMNDSPLIHATLEDVVFENERICLAGDRTKCVTLTSAMKQGGVGVIEHEVSEGPALKQNRYSRYTHAAIFAEVKVDEDFGTVHVTRLVSAVAAGRILNPKTARSQVLGGMVWGIGSALHEESKLDHKYGRFMNHNLAEYHVPVNADVHDVRVLFVEEHDDIVNPLGAKGLGEIGIIGVAGAIANAVFHATGRRVRKLPITPESLI
jgi:xanthine dehydrogenase YagR molybdenum-binding subunit